MVKDDASDASQTAASATSSVVPMRIIGCILTNMSRSASSVTMSVSPPSITPGARQFARIPWVAYSTAIVFVIWCTPAFDAL